MENESTPTTTHWPLIILFALVSAGGVYALNYAFSEQGNLNSKLVAQQKALREQLAETQAALAAKGSAEQVVAPLQAELAQSKETIALLEARLESVEKTASAPAPVIEMTPPPAGETQTLQAFLGLRHAIESGAPYAEEMKQMDALPQVKEVLQPLRPLAEQGIPSESKLRGDLAELLAAQTPTPAADAKLDGLNSKLKGLLHITRKQAAATDPYSVLRAQVDTASIDVLVTSVSDLPADAQAPFTAWLDDARQRQAALTSLAAAESALMKPAQ